MSFLEDKIQTEGLTFDDVLLIPAYSEVLPREVSIASRFSRNVQIKDTEAFAEKVVQKYEENSFRTTKFSVDLGEDIDLVRFHVYLRREEIGEKEELFQIRYQDGDIILDGINGKR